MIELVPGQPDGVIELTASGTVTGADYENVVYPAVEAALEKTDRIRLLFHLGTDFEGYDLGGMWDDTKLGLRHWDGFERVAVVTDTGWMRELVRGFGVFVSCPVKAFGLAELDDARRWLRESIGSVHLDFDDSADLVTVRLLGKLEPSAYDDVNEELDAWLAHRDRMKLIVDLREFDGFQGLAALGRHLNLVREHRRLPSRVAVVGHADWQRLAVRVMSRFVGAETRYFGHDDIRGASAWAKG